MHWKILITVVVILAIFSLLAFTQSLQNAFSFMKKNAGYAVSTLFRTGSGEPFSVIINMNKEALYGHSFKLTNSTFIGFGNYVSILIDDGSENNPSRDVEVMIENINGQFTIGKNGNVIITGQSSYIKINDVERSRAKPYKIQMEISPSKYSLTNLAEDQISISSATGEVKRVRNEQMDSAGMANSKLTIKSFYGHMRTDEGGTILTGITNFVEGSGFRFV